MKGLRKDFVLGCRSEKSKVEVLQRQITNSCIALFRYGIITKCLHLHLSPAPTAPLSLVRPVTAIPICWADDDETICGQGEAPKAMQHLLPFANSNHVGRSGLTSPPPHSSLIYENNDK